MQKQKKIYLVDGLVDMRLGVAADDEDEARREARQVVKKVIETGAFGTVGWTFNIKDVREAKPVEKQ
ncbi:MAG: hypothetical protein JRN11_07870 [Nitrososphaerota archaeon]|jgi:hypothetical protein|nr:hypothetical protein [Nitrososphaerota archaeon]MDG6951551.1 hypothetical protein [Nitrososphaerota archaeon]MDG6991056.1 hypothetical protein [Nitrososphaerota archaeon]MDG7016520.1 hypothetical protein [Nitrososphaerota archaeon]MDG7026649.1 hypothetical protein [Nitrososphaerota archaeon]